MVVGSIKSSADAFDPTVLWVPKNLDFGNFTYAAKVLDLKNSLRNTFFLEIITAMLQFFACAVAGYGLSRFNFKGRRIMYVAMILNILVPVTMVITPSYVNFSHMDFLGILSLISKIIGHDIRPNLIDTPGVFYLPALLGVGLKGGLFIYIFSQFYKSIPKELEEAAWVDGAGPVKTFMRIVAPSSGPAAITVLLFSIVWHWNDYFLAQMYASSMPTISVELNNFNLNEIIQVMGGAGLTKANLNYVSITLAICIIFLIPMLLFYLVIQRKFIASVANSGIVG
jgi:multiple sugar transport system permease protein